MKLKITPAVLWPIVFLIVAFALIIIKPWQTKTTETIIVSAAGKAEAIPNIAKISATIQSIKPNLDDARAQNEQIVSEIVTKLKNLGIAQKDIKTNYISGNSQSDPGPLIYMRPKNYSPSPQATMTTTLEITVRDFKLADSVITTLTSNKATNIYGPQLTIDDTKLETAKSEARANAIESAKKKAQELAKASGRGVGKVTKIAEQGDYGYPIPMIAKSGAELDQKASQIQPGQNEVTINLSVEFSLK